MQNVFCFGIYDIVLFIQQLYDGYLNIPNIEAMISDCFWNEMQISKYNELSCTKFAIYNVQLVREMYMYYV